MRKALVLFAWLAWPVPAEAGTTHDVIPSCCFSFSPSVLNITAGDTVRWSPLSGHNVTETDSPSSTTYNGGFLGSGSSYSHIFNTPGTYYYLCTVPGHDSMRGTIHVAAAPTATPSNTASPPATPTESPSSSPTATATPSDSPTGTVTPTDSPTPDPALSPTDTPLPSPTPSQSPSHTDSPTATATPSVTSTSTVSPTPSWTPSATESATPQPSPTPSPLHSPTASPTALALSAAGVQGAGLLASPIRNRMLRVWAELTGAAQGAELRVYSAALTLIQAYDLGPQGPGQVHWHLPLAGAPTGPVWVQLRLRHENAWKPGPILRSYVLP